MIRYLVILLVIVLALAWASIASAAVQLDGQGCMEYAIWSRDLVWARDVGADREKVRASLAEMRVETGAAGVAAGVVFALLLRDLDRLWDTTASRHAVMQTVARDCVARRGLYGDEI